MVIIIFILVGKFFLCLFIGNKRFNFNINVFLDNIKIDTDFKIKTTGVVAFVVVVIIVVVVTQV